MTEEKKEAVEVTENQLGELIGKQLGDILKPVTESVETLTKEVADIKAAGPRIVQEPETDPKEEEEKSFEQRSKKFKSRKEYDEYELPPKDQFSFVRFINAQREKDWRGADYERWAMEETRKKSISWASGSSGGYWVDSQFLPEEFITNLTAQIVVRNAGARVLPLTGAPVNIPSKTAGATAYWVTQNAAITASDQTPGQTQLTPKWCVGRTQISEFLAQTSAGAAEQIVREDLAEVIGLEVDKQSLVGTGTTNKPTGLVNVSSINTVAIGTNGGALTMAHLHSMLYEMEVDNAARGKMAWVMHPRTWNVIRQYQVVTYSGATASMDYVIGANKQEETTKMLLGYPVYLSTQLSIALTKGSGTALAYVILANMADIILGEWGPIQIKATDVGGNAWAQNAIEVKATYTMDIAARHANSICVISDTSS